MNKGQLRDRTRMLAGAELDGLRAPDEVDLIVEEAYRQIGLLERWKWRHKVDTFTTVDGTDEYDLPVTVSEPMSVQVLDANGYSTPVRLSEMPLSDLLTRVDRSDHALPRYYSLTGLDAIYLGPTPDKAYTVEVFGLAPLAGLDSDEDEPEWDSRFHSAIAYLAAATLLDEEGQADLAQARRSKAQEMMAEMIDHYQLSKDFAPVQIGGGQHVRGDRRLGRAWPWRG